MRQTPPRFDKAELLRTTACVICIACAIGLLIALSTEADLSGPAGIPSALMAHDETGGRGRLGRSSLPDGGSSGAPSVSIRSRFGYSASAHAR